MDAPSPSPPITITNRDELEAWLKDKPRDVCVTIASRAALRVWPLCNQLKANRGYHLEKDVFIPLFRGILSSTSTSTSTSAAAAAYAYASAAAYAANAAAYARAADAIWLSVNGDIAAFEAGKSVEAVRALPLWQNEAGEVDTPKWAQDAWQQFKTKFLGYKNGWEIWVEWYERRLRGAPFTKQDLAKDKAFARALEDLDLWQEPDEKGKIGKGKNREASEVNTRIKALIDDELAKLALPKKFDFFISFNEHDLEDAKFINSVIEAQGFKTFAQFKHMKNGNNIPISMNEGLRDSERLVCVLSATYRTSDACQAEWSAFYQQDYAGRKRKIISFLVKQDEKILPLHKSSIYGSLFDKSVPEREKVIIDALKEFSPERIQSEQHLQEATAGVYAVAPSPIDGKLESKVIPISNACVEKYGHSSEELFESIREKIDNVHKHIHEKQNINSNYDYSQQLKNKIQKLSEIFSGHVNRSKPLSCNTHIIEVLRQLKKEQDEGMFADNDLINDYFRDLQAIYRELEDIFPNLKKYRNAQAQNRFEMPNTAQVAAINAIARGIQSPDASQVMKPELQEEISSSLQASLKVQQENAHLSAEEQRKAAAPTALDAQAKTFVFIDAIDDCATSADKTPNKINEFKKLHETLKPHWRVMREWMDKIW